MAILKNTVINDTGALVIPYGTTAGRPGSPASGMIRFNTSTSAFEWHNGTAWSRDTSIVSSNLVFHVDANDYSGSGNWVDKTANAIAMVPTVTPAGSANMPFTTLDGVKCFKCNGTGYFESSSTDGQKFYTGDGGTIEMWYFNRGIYPRRTIIEKAGDTYASYQQEFAFTLEPGGQVSTYRNGGATSTYDYSNFAGMALNQWNHICVMLPSPTNSRPDGWAIFNGGTRQYTFGVRETMTAPRQALNLRISYGYAGVVAQGYIAIVRIYNRTLTDAEVNQNFQAERGRFGV